MRTEVSLNNFVSGDSSSSADINHGPKKSNIPIIDCSKLAAHDQLANNIRKTPPKTQAAGGFSESPLISKNISAAPTKVIAVEPIQIPNAGVATSKAMETLRFSIIIEVFEDESSSFSCCFTNHKKAAKQSDIIIRKYPATSKPAAPSSNNCTILMYGSLYSLASSLPTKECTEAHTPFARVTNVAWIASAPASMPRAGEASIAESLSESVRARACTIINSANQGRIEPVSTGSQAQYPPQSSTV